MSTRDLLERCRGNVRLHLRAAGETRVLFSLQTFPRVCPEPVWANRLFHIRKFKRSAGFSQVLDGVEALGQSQLMGSPALPKWGVPIDQVLCKEKRLFSFGVSLF
jgi:hypothetical protein